MENATTEVVTGRRASPKIGVDLTLEPGAAQTTRWVHAGIARMPASLERAQFWLRQDWAAIDKSIESAAAQIPVVETGGIEQDAAIAFAYHHLMQSYLQTTEHLPHPSFVTTRRPDHGFSTRGDGSDYGRGWNGQQVHAAYLTSLATATVDAQLAQSIIRNYLAVQREDGWIDMQPGLGGQRSELLCPPLLARMTWSVYQLTRDEAFLAESFSHLLDFFNRWFESDLDVDGNVLPEWQDERQTGYVFWPTFAAGQPWSQNTAIHYVETPDMAAYLLSEANSLVEMARELGNPGEYELRGRVADLQQMLEAMWYPPGERYAYRDRDTSLTTHGVPVLEDVRGDEEHLPALKLDPRSRLVVRVSGGTGQPPRASLYLEGLNAAGQTISETVDMKDFAWSYGNGIYTSSQVYAQIDRVRFTGLSRVFRITVHTLDLTRLDINAVLPLWSRGAPAERIEALVGLATNEAHFVRPSGLTIVSAQDANYDPSSANGGGGVWSYWTTLIGEALIDAGRMDAATALVRRLLRTQVAVLKQDKHFSEFYHSSEARGLGERSHVSGIVPLYLLMRVLGIQVINNAQVWAGGEFHWPSPVMVHQHGVTVRRSAERTEIEFPSGHRTTLPPEADWQLVVDPTPVLNEMAAPSTPPRPPESLAPGRSGRVIIEVEADDE
jgi:hypothetical protein